VGLSAAGLLSRLKHSVGSDVPLLARLQEVAGGPRLGTDHALVLDLWKTGNHFGIGKETHL